jgi:hypothetical protein
MGAVKKANASSPRSIRLPSLGGSAAPGSSTVFVVAGGPLEARRTAEAHLQDLGVLPGGPPGLHENFERMCEFARRGRR